MTLKPYIIALLALSVISCTREPLPELDYKEGKLVTISATIPPETRVAYNDTTLKLSWQIGDTLLLAGYDDTTYIGRKKFGWTGTGCTFSGEEVPGATTYKAYYPGNVITLDNDGNVQLPDNFWDQRQNGDSTTAHLRNKLLLFDEEAHSITQIFNLTLKSSIIKLDLSSVPKEVGKLHQLVYTVETAWGVFESVSLDVTNVTFSLAKHSLLAFLAFDPVEMKINAGRKVMVTLSGKKLYQWSKPVTDGKEYAAGHRYTGTVSSGWKEMINPLSFVAKYNVNPAGTGFVGDSTSCTGSGYFNWEQANAISVPGYHLPSRKEWRSIVPEAYGYVFFKTTVDKNNITEYVTVRNQNITMTCDYRNVGTETNPAPSYALRYKGTDMLSAWKYEYLNYNTNNCHLKVTCRNVVPSVTIGDIANAEYWTTNTKNDVVRYFPASGWMSSGHPNIVGTGGFFWSSTKYIHPTYDHLYYCMYFSPTVVHFHRNDKLLEYSVRLFYDTD